eukprot:1176770-Amphidinium_carterae.1
MLPATTTSSLNLQRAPVLPCAPTQDDIRFRCSTLVAQTNRYKLMLRRQTFEHNAQHLQNAV